MGELTSVLQETKSIHVAVVADLSQRLLSTKVEVIKIYLLFFYSADRRLSIICTEYTKYIHLFLSFCCQSSHLKARFKPQSFKVQELWTGTHLRFGR